MGQERCPGWGWGSPGRYVMNRRGLVTIIPCCNLLHCWIRTMHFTVELYSVWFDRYGSHMTSSRSLYHFSWKPCSIFSFGDCNATWNFVSHICDVCMSRETAILFCACTTDQVDGVGILLKVCNYQSPFQQKKASLFSALQYQQIHLPLCLLITSAGKKNSSIVLELTVSLKTRW